MRRIGMDSRFSTLLLITLVTISWCRPHTSVAQFRDVTPGINQPEEVESPVNEVTGESPAPEPDALPESDQHPTVADPVAAEADADEGADVEKTDESTEEAVAETDLRTPLEAVLAGEIEVKPIPADAVQPVRFSGILVGSSTLQDLTDNWGEPFKVMDADGAQILKYRIHPFRQVDVTVRDKQVNAILIHLEEALDPAHCAAELRMSHLEPVPVPDEYGLVLGLAYPERGVLFSFDAFDSNPLVTKIQLEPITPEPFALRAEYDFEQQFAADLQDLDKALSMNPKFAQAFWLKATILEKTGRYRDALEAANEAAHLESANAQYQMTKARLLARTGNYDVAVRAVKDILDWKDVPTAVRAAAECELGTLLAEGPKGNFKAGMDHHLAAIELAATLANDRRFQERRLAKLVLIEAHMAVARDISRGNFRKQGETVSKWLNRSQALLEELVQRDQGDPALRLDVFRAGFAAQADLRYDDEIDEIVDRVLEEGRQQIANAKDELGRARLEWKLGAALAESVHLMRLQGNYDEALRLADGALVLLKNSAKSRQSTPDQKYVVGRLFFEVGSMHAVAKRDHAEAIRWFAKAEPLLSSELPLGVMVEPDIHGESFVSMGVSYWEEGNRSRAIDLTEQGADILQQAVLDGVLKTEILVIPYGNLSTMHKLVGNDDDSKAFAEMANNVDALSAKTLR